MIEGQKVSRGKQKGRAVKQERVNMDQIWKFMTTALIGAIIGGIPGYFFVGPTKVTRPEVLELVNKYSPYVEDKKVILATIDENQESIKEMKPVLERINVRLAEQNTKIDYIVRNIKK